MGAVLLAHPSHHVEQRQLGLAAAEHVVDLLFVIPEGPLVLCFVDVEKELDLHSIPLRSRGGTDLAVGETVILLALPHRLY